MTLMVLSKTVNQLYSSFENVFIQDVSPSLFKMV